MVPVSIEVDHIPVVTIDIVLLTAIDLVLPDVDCIIHRLGVQIIRLKLIGRLI